MLMNVANVLLKRFGMKIVTLNPKICYPDFSDDDISTIEFVQPFTMTSPERIHALIQAVNYIVSADIEGDIVECGVWRGGSMMAVANTLAKLQKNDINLWLYDTFEGMTQPGEHDISYDGQSAVSDFETAESRKKNQAWCYSSYEDVKNNLFKTGYNPERMKFIRGKVENTIPDQTPEKISLLRLDTDWYESTHHELIHLYPRLSPGGVIIIDDYGHWQGSKKASDDYFLENRIKILLNRVDYTGRIALKP